MLPFFIPTYVFSIEHYCHDWSISQFPQQFAQNPWHISHLLLSWLETFVLERCCVKLVILQQILHSAQPPFVCFHFTVMGGGSQKNSITEKNCWLRCYFLSWLVLTKSAHLTCLRLIRIKTRLVSTLVWDIFKFKTRAMIDCCKKNLNKICKIDIFHAG